MSNRSFLRCVLVLIASIFAISASPAWAEEQFPSWVPPEAVRAAREVWFNSTNHESSDRLFIKHGISSSSDLARSALMHPRKLVDIDYESYQPGSDIFAMFSPHKNGFGFSVYIDDRYVGTVEVALKNQQWIMMGVGGPGLNARDFYGGIYSQYPPSMDLIIYQKVDGAFFIIEGNEVIDSFYWDVETRTFKEMDPAQYITNERARIIEYKKSAYYQHYLDVKKQMHEDSLKVKAASARAPLDTVPPKK
ncbi:MAG: hypothetical protein NTW97_11080 [Candidatus Krumholzibacteria bacterium]|nr:hypothetical protein [Candidatus Krumholzibacteria bacterium]